MKRLITIILILALILPASSLADVILNGMTTDELLELRRQINLQLFNEKLLDGVDVDPGKYIVGEDLPAGDYRVEVILPSQAYAFGSVWVYDPGETFLTVGGNMTGEGYERIGKLSLTDSQTIEVTLYSVKLFLYEGIVN